MHVAAALDVPLAAVIRTLGTTTVCIAYHYTARYSSGDGDNECGRINAGFRLGLSNGRAIPF
jgi:hypothetical protein